MTLEILLSQNLISGDICETERIMFMKHEKCTAVIVAAGSGKRMGTQVSKQFLNLKGRPLLAYTLDVFQASQRIDEIILVVSHDMTDYVQREFVEKYGYSKVSRLVIGGAQRYESVYAGLLACVDTDYVFIHDGVRPFVTEDIIERGYQTVRKYGAAVCAVQAKDTIKIVNEKGIVTETPVRSKVWSVQTPQIFQYDVIRKAYDMLQMFDKDGITDDAMVLEEMGNTEVHVFKGDYFNIKITTPEDLDIAERFLEKKA